MPLSEHEQRMLDQIESALYAEDPKFASSVRGGTLRAPSTRRRLKGAGLFVVGLAMLIAGVPFYSQNHAFLIVSVIGFVVMFAGVVVATTGPPRRRQGQGQPAVGWPARQEAQGRRVGRSPVAWRTGSAVGSTSESADAARPIVWRRKGAADRPPLFCA